jgi:hypothetical protein
MYLILKCSNFQSQLAPSSGNAKNRNSVLGDVLVPIFYCIEELHAHFCPVIGLQISDTCQSAHPTSAMYRLVDECHPALRLDGHQGLGIDDVI